MNSVVQIADLHKTFVLQDVAVRALNDVSLDIPDGQFVAIVGASGSGKSTLLNQLGCLDNPSGGYYRLRGTDVSQFDDDRLTALRNREIGFVFQSYNLIPQLTVLDNIAVPLLYDGHPREAARARSREVAELVGIADRLQHCPNQLSGGQQQRVAIARAIVNDPQLILADEPTGNLDSHSSNEIMELLALLNSRGKTVILVTHDDELAASADRVIRLSDGRIVEDRLTGAGPQVTSRERTVTSAGHTDQHRLRPLVKAVELIRMSAANLFLNGLRSCLTILGVVLGVACLVAMLAIGEGSSRHAQQQIQELGATTIIVQSVMPLQESASVSRTSRVVDYGITEEDSLRLSTVDSISSVVAAREISKELRNTSMSLNGKVIGTTPEYKSSHRLSMRRGRFLSPIDIDSYANVAVLGSEVAGRLFPGRDPIGRSVKMREEYFTVIGICQPRAASTSELARSLSVGSDNAVFVPLTTANLRFGKIQGQARAGQLSYVTTPLTELRISVRNVGEVPATAQVIRDLMSRFHPAGDYRITVPLELMEQAERTKRMFNVILGSIGAISLLVGGIGIMNISLASVTERTKEIGIRRAVGARRRDIVVQFLCESVMLCVLGGLIGLALSTGLAFVCQQLGKLTGFELADDVRIIGRSIPFRWFMAYFSASVLGAIAMAVATRRLLRSELRAQLVFNSLVAISACILVGFVFGIGLPYLITDIVDWYFDYDVPIGMNYWSLALAFGVSIAIGIAFGTYPARRAASLPPIDALRRE